MAKENRINDIRISSFTLVFCLSGIRLSDHGHHHYAPSKLFWIHLLIVRNSNYLAKKAAVICGLWITLIQFDMLQLLVLLHHLCVLFVYFDLVHSRSAQSQQRQHDREQVEEGRQWRKKKRVNSKKEEDEEAEGWGISEDNQE